VRRVMVRYRVKAERAAQNVALVRDVYDELHGSRPDGLRYATFRMDDGVGFVHIAETVDGRTPLAEVAAFARFQEGIADRCDEPPVVTELETVGSYRIFEHD
jgi:hypothetical protein